MATKPEGKKGINLTRYSAMKRSVLGLARINLTRKRLSRIKLEKQVKMVLLGTLLGDGSLGIYDNYSNARFQMRHSVKQTEWFNWKASVLKDLGTEKGIHFQKADGFQVNKGSATSPQGKWHFQTRALPVLTELLDIISKKGKKYVKREWLNQLTAEALAVWWLDDGSLVKNRKNGIFCTQGFSLKENKVLSSYLKVVWGVQTKVTKATQKKNAPISNQYVLRLNTENLRSFLKIIMPFIPVSSMIYKCCVDDIDIELQQRWISEMKRTLPQFSVEIDRIYAMYSKNYTKRRERHSPIRIKPELRSFITLFAEGVEGVGKEFERPS